MWSLWWFLKVFFIVSFFVKLSFCNIDVKDQLRKAFFHFFSLYCEWMNSQYKSFNFLHCLYLIHDGYFYLHELCLFFNFLQKDSSFLYRRFSFFAVYFIYLCGYEFDEEHLAIIHLHFQQNFQVSYRFLLICFLFSLILRYWRLLNTRSIADFFIFWFFYLG